MSGTGRVDVALGVSDLPIAELRDVARTADELGYGCLWLAEGVGPDIFSVLTQLAVVTERIDLGTGIVNVFSRTPTTIALAADTVLSALGRRRLHLGVGASGKALIEKFHGVAHERPLARVRDAVRVVDSVFTTGRLPDGLDTLRAEAGVRVPITSSRDRLQIYVASLGPVGVRATGQLAEGWLPIWLSASRGRSRLAILEEAAAAAGRPRPEVAAYLYTAVSHDDAVIDHVRATLAWYVAANGTAYARLLREDGQPELVQTICERWHRGDRAGARRAIEDEVLHDRALVGGPEAVAAGIRRFRDAGVDRPVLRLPHQLSAGDVIHMLRDLARAIEEASP